MICCDRCSEWYHGDCVGISQARGHLLEKNGEDYICPSCSPCQSPIEFVNRQPALSKEALSSSSESLFASSAGEERPSEDEGIKGKIRKSSTRSTKRRFKLFPPVTWLCLAEMNKPGQTAPDDRNSSSMISSFIILPLVFVPYILFWLKISLILDCSMIL